MNLTRRLVGVAAASAIALAIGGQAAVAAPQSHQHGIPDNVPGFVKHATRVGATDSATTLHLTVWLQQPNESALQSLLRSQYTPHSANYHHWLTPEQFAARFSATPDQVASVRDFLASEGITVTSVPGNRLYVNATATMRQAEQAFNVSIDNYRWHGATYYANGAAPTVTGPAGSLISFVGGLDDAPAFQYARSRPQPSTAVVYDALCGDFDTTKTLHFTDGTSKEYKGFVPCGYNGAQLRKAYGADATDGLTGAGQTVAITDAYGSPTLQNDVAAFARDAGLYSTYKPKVTQLGPVGTANKKESPAQDPLGWQAEVTLDAEAVYAMAPEANILVLAAPNNYADLDQAINTVVVKHLADIVTNSWGYSTDIGPKGQAQRDERIFEQAAAEGIGLNFSSGDGGDEVAATGVKSVDFPASSPWVTAVGGTSLFLDSDGGYGFETGWGTNISKLAGCASSETDPVTGFLDCKVYDASSSANLGFDGGAGGGLSSIWTAQPWQSAAISRDTAAGFGTVGTHRAVPDVGMLADPYTGMAVNITDLSAGDTSPEIEPYGGTSLASPLFAGVMALVDQSRAENGQGHAGLASQYLYKLPKGAVRDVTAPPTGAGNQIDDPDSFSLFYGSRYSGSLFAPTFNEDSSLATAPGWDDVTGVGSPYVPDFVTALSKK